MAHENDDPIPISLHRPLPLTLLMLADLEGFEGVICRHRSDAGTRKGLRARGLVALVDGTDRLTTTGHAALDAAVLTREIYRRRIDQLEELEGARQRAAIGDAAIEQAGRLGG